MYFTRLAKWEEKDWREFFNRYPLIVSSNIEENIKTIMEGDKRSITNGKSIFYKYGICNGVGVGLIPKTGRKILTMMFRQIDSFFHDLEYAIGGTTKDKMKADIGLLKYSFLSLYYDYKGIYCIESMYEVVRILLVILYTPIALFKFLGAILCFIMVVSFGHLAFNYKDPVEIK